jgi:high-affinity iron transporter
MGLALVALVLGLVLVGAEASPAGAADHDCSQGSLSRQEAIDQLRQVRLSIDRSLRLLDDGRRDDAFAEARGGYLNCFESVEAPLDVVAGVKFRFDVENAFARVRNLISSGASTGEARDAIVELRGRIDETERKLTSTGIGAPLLVFGQSYVILLREGLEVVLVLAALLAFLESSGTGGEFRRPILAGVGAAAVATVITYFAVDAIFDVLPFGREVLEALVGLLAVAVLFYVSFWLAARMDQRRWLEFLKARVWRAASAGSMVSLALVGFTSVYREGFETVLFYQALFAFGGGMSTWIWLGIAASAVTLGIVGVAMLRLGRALPVRTFLTVAVIVVMATSIAVMGNAMRALQESAVIDLRMLDGWPDLPIFLAQATGYYPTLPSVVAQAVLTVIYAVGGWYAFVIVPKRRSPARSEVAAGAH